MSPDLIGAAASFGVAGLAALVLLVDDARARAARIGALEVSVGRLTRPASVGAARIEAVVIELELTGDPLTTCADCYFSGRSCPEHAPSSA